MHKSAYANKTIAPLPVLDSIETSKLIQEQEDIEMETFDGPAFKGIINGLIVSIPFWGLIACIAIWLI